MLNRRTFLRTASAGAAAGLTLGAADGHSAKPEKKRLFTLDLRCGSIGVRADLRQAIDLAHKYGFESIEPSTSALEKMDNGQIEGIQSVLKQKGLVWGGAGMPVNFRGEEAAFQADLERLPAGAKALRRAGATRVSTWITPTHDSLDYRENLRQHARRLGQIAAVLGDHGIRLGLEYVGPKTSWSKGKFPFVHTMAQARELIGAIGRDDVGLVLDSWHWYTAHETEADLLSLTNKDVVACDLNDAPEGVAIDEQIDNVRRLPAATGVIDLKTFLGALVTIGYDGPVRAEPFYQPLREMSADDAVAMTAAAMKKAFALVQ